MRPDFGLFGLHREIDRLFSEFAQGVGPNGAQNIAPNIEISETDKAIEVTAERPGLERKDGEISVDDDTLTIRGEKKIEENQKDKNVQLRERSYGVFLRGLPLPAGVDRPRVQATRSNWVSAVPHAEACQIRAEQNRSQGRGQARDQGSRLRSPKRWRDAFAVFPPD